MGLDAGFSAPSPILQASFRIDWIGYTKLGHSRTKSTHSSIYFNKPGNDIDNFKDNINQRTLNPFGVALLQIEDFGLIAHDHSCYVRPAVKFYMKRNITLRAGDRANHRRLFLQND